MNSMNLRIWGGSCTATAVFFLFLSPTLSPAKIFCIQTTDEFQAALTKSAANKENDLLKIVQGTELDDFQLPQETGYLIKIESGYTADCTERETAPSVPKVISAAERMQPAASPQQSTTGPVPPTGVEAKNTMFSAAALSGGGGQKRGAFSSAEEQVGDPIAKIETPGSFGQ